MKRERDREKGREKIIGLNYSSSIRQSQVRNVFEKVAETMFESDFLSKTSAEQSEDLQYVSFVLIKHEDIISLKLN